MIVCRKGVELEDEGDKESLKNQAVSNTKQSSAEVLVPQGSPSSTHVVIVMDALRGFSWEPLQWALDHISATGYTITLLGVMPWIPLPLSCKTWLDVWTFDLGDLSALKGRSDWKNDQKSQKIRGIINLCDQKGVVPCMKVAMGHPLKLVVLEHTTSLHATFVVLDRHLRKDKTFFAERLPSSAVMMNRNGGVDMLKIQSPLDQSSPTQGELSPSPFLPVPEVILSEELSELFRAKIHEVDKDHQKM
ncbi:hypothetical protein Tsubulata_045708 [Turnera subulata]|uniref:Uncharacterized protein n=1 Tax=Turnera subulata TaxID=218843 RepID=A0A9Q0FR65_9ROSI|nr:hypothetical protein Tsubulata_045708 [Turnera subulata]